MLFSEELSDLFFRSDLYPLKYRNKIVPSLFLCQSPAVLALDYLEFSCEQCNPSPETVDRVIVMIKALGNAGRLTTNPINLLYCGLDSNYKNVTVAVLQSLRTIPHSPEVSVWYMLCF